MKFFLQPERNSDSANTLKIQHTEPQAIALIADRLTATVGAMPTGRDIVMICIGTDRSTGDSLGPLVGSGLAKAEYLGFHVYGTLDHPVHAMNLNEILTEVQQRFCDPYIIAVDACLGKLSSIGCIHIAPGPVKPGAGVNKELPSVGDMHITGVVNVGGFMEYFVLQNTRLSLVVKMAQVIADGMDASLRQCSRSSASAAPWTAASSTVKADLSLSKP